MMVIDLASSMKITRQSPIRSRQPLPPFMTVANDLAVRWALEAAGVIFIDENGDAGPAVRLRKRQ